MNLPKKPFERTQKFPTVTTRESYFLPNTPNVCHLVAADIRRFQAYIVSPKLLPEFIEVCANEPQKKGATLIINMFINAILTEIESRGEVLEDEDCDTITLIKSMKTKLIENSELKVQHTFLFEEMIAFLVDNPYREQETLKTIGEYISQYRRLVKVEIDLNSDFYEYTLSLLHPNRKLSDVTPKNIISAYISVFSRRLKELNLDLTTIKSLNELSFIFNITYGCDETDQLAVKTFLIGHFYRFVKTGKFEEVKLIKIPLPKN